MLSKAQIKHITTLRQKKYREEHNQFIAEGEKTVADLLASNFNVLSIYALPAWIKGNSALIHNHDTGVFEITEGELSRISNLATPNQVLAITEIPSFQIDPAKLEHELVLVLDDISDPGNLGTIIRIADWFGINYIICSEFSVDVYNPKVIQATMGSVSRVNLHYTYLGGFLKELPFTPKIYGTLLEGENIYKADLSPEGFIIIGNEARGISNDLQQHITHRLHIPAYTEGKIDQGVAESLNASVAAALVCGEFRRRM